MRTVSKTLVDEIARLERKYVETGDTDFLSLKHIRCEEFAKGIGFNAVTWSGVSDLFSALCGVCPVKQCSNEDIYFVLRLLDIEVIQ